MSDRMDPLLRDKLRQIVRLVGLEQTIATAREIDQELAKPKRVVVETRSPKAIERAKRIAKIPYGVHR